MDRLRALRPVAGRRLRGGIRAGSLLKHQVPVRAYADWDDKRLGFVEIDLVPHDGGNPRGAFACTLTLTDVCTGWTEIIAAPNRDRCFERAFPRLYVMISARFSREVTNRSSARFLREAPRSGAPIHL